MGVNPEELLEHADFVRGLARSLVVDENTTADITQETWLAALEHTSPKGKPLGAWLSRVARNFARKKYRSERRRRNREWRSARPDRVPSTAEIVAREETRKRVVDAVTRLKEPYRSAIILRFYENLPPRRMAGILKVPVETAKTQIKRGLAHLREILDTEYGNDRRSWLLAAAPLAGVELPSASAAAVAMAVTTKIKIGIGAAAVIAAGITLTFFWGEELPKGSSYDAPAATRTQQEEDGTSKAIQASDPGGHQKRVALVSELPAVELKGNVVSKKNREGLADALVKINPLPYQEDAPVAETVTDAKGEFSVVVPHPADSNPTAYHLRISAEGFLDIETTLPSSTDENHRDCGSFFLTEDRIYTINLKDEAGHPVPQARLTFFKHNPKHYRLEKTSDTQGRVQILESELQWGDWRTNAMAFRVEAAGLCEHCRDFNPGELLTDVMMVPESSWMGYVKDKDTGSGIAGAELSIQSNFYPDMFTGNPPAITNAEGAFVLPRIAFPEADMCTPELLVQAEGYIELREPIPEEDFLRKEQSPLELKLARNIKPVETFLVVNGKTGNPIPGLALKVDGKDVVTNDEGCFHHVPYRTIPWVVAPGYRYEKRELPSGKAGSNGVRLIRLTPLVQERQAIKVVDELRRPVTSAHARIVYRIGDKSWNQDRQTDSQGCAEFTLFADKETTAFVSIDKPGYFPFVSDFFPLGSTSEPIRTFTLKRGILYQGLRVMDVGGNPLQGMEVLALLLPENGEVMTVRGVSDDLGTCDMVFFPFREGILCIEDHPETYTEIFFETILEQGEIIIGPPRTQPCAVTIRARIEDEAGRPLRGVTVKQYDNADSGFLRRVKSSADGFAVLPAFKSESYKIRFSPTCIDATWYRTVPETYTDLLAGAELNITMSAHNGVRIIYDDLADTKRYSNEDLEKAEVRLETEDGLPVPALKAESENVFTTLFLNVPPGRMRAVLEFPDGTRRESPAFDLEEGESLLIRRDKIYPIRKR